MLAGTAGAALGAPAAGTSAAGGSGSIAQADEAEVIKIDDEEEELQPKTSMDALLAQQLASELERGSYAQVLARRQTAVWTVNSPHGCARTQQDMWWVAPARRTC